MPRSHNARRERSRKEEDEEKNPGGKTGGEGKGRGVRGRRGEEWISGMGRDEEREGRGEGRGARGFPKFCRVS